MSQFKIGDVVTLKSGGPKMTVAIDLTGHDPPFWQVMWYEGGECRTANIPPECLIATAPEPKPRDESVYAIRWGVRVRKALERHPEVSTLRELSERTAEELIDWRNFGYSSLQEVRRKLAERGLTLKGE